MNFVSPDGLAWGIRVMNGTTIDGSDSITFAANATTPAGRRHEEEELIVLGDEEDEEDGREEEEEEEEGDLKKEWY